MPRKIGIITGPNFPPLDVVLEDTGEVSIMADPPDVYACLDDMKGSLYTGFEFIPNSVQSPDSA